GRAPPGPAGTRPTRRAWSTSAAPVVPALRHSRPPIVSASTATAPSTTPGIAVSRASLGSTPDGLLRARYGPADQGGFVRARGPGPHLRRVHAPLDDRPPARSRRGGDRRGRDLRPARPHRPPRRGAGSRPEWRRDARRAVRPARRARPLPGRAAGARALPPLPPLGV